jgi:RNA polymerase-binding transcription factor DksA
MASKKKTIKKAAKPAKKAVKKPAKPAKKAAKPVKKPAKKVAKPAKKAAKPVKKASKPVKKAAKPAKKPVAKKPVKKVVAQKPVKPVKAPKPEKPAKVVEAKVPKPEPIKPVKQPKPEKRSSQPKYESMMRKTVDVKSLPKPPVPQGKPTVFYSNQKALDHTKAGKIDERTRYNDEELKEFKEIILLKLAEARKDLDMLRSSLTHTSDNGTDDTSPTFKMMEDGSETLSREETAQLAGRQEKFIQALEAALIRIENKTYGVCRVTGRLINKERLKLVPHTTLSIEAKNMQN